MAMDIHDLEEAWQAEPGDPETFSALAGRYIIDGSWRKLVALFDEGADQLADDASYGTRLVQALRELEEHASEPRERGGILVAIGDAYLKYVDDREEAMKAYQSSFKAYPQDTTCLERARSIYRRTGDFERVFLLYKLELKVKTTPGPRSEVLVAMAQIRGDDLRDSEGALQIVEEALKLTPDAPLANLLLEIYREGATLYGRQQEFLRDADEAEDAAEPEMASEYLVMAADVERQREAGSNETALEYAERAMSLDPDNVSAAERVAGLRRIVGIEPAEASVPTNGAAASLDEESESMATQRIDVSTLEMYRQEDRHHAYEQSEADDVPADEAGSTEEVDRPVDEFPDHETMRVELEALDPVEEEEEAPPQPVDEFPDHETMAVELEALDPAPEEHPEHHEEDETPPQPVDEFPDHETMAVELEALDTDEPGEEAPVEAEEEESEPEPEAEEEEEEEPDVYESAQTVRHEAVTINLDGVEGISNALQADPTNLEFLEALYQAANEEGAWAQYVETAERSLKRLRKQEGELETMVRVATALWQHVDDVDRAEYYFKRVKLLDGENQQMLDFYGDYFRERGEWRKLFAMLSTAQQHASDASSRAELTERLAELAEHSMGSPEKAIDVWKGALRDDASNERARNELRRLYEENEKWSALVDFYKEDLAALEREGASDVERVDMLKKMAAIYDDHLSLEPMVINTLNDILALDAHDDAAFNRLRELLVSSRRMNDLANLLNDRAESAIENGDVALAAEYLEEVATIWMDDLRNVTQALPYLRRVLEIDPSNVAVREKLKVVYEKRRDYSSLFEVLRLEVEDLEGSERLARLRELVELAVDRIRDAELAIPVLHQVLEEAPGDADSLNKLEFIYRRHEEYEPLAEVLLSRAQHEEDVGAQIAALGEAASLYDNQLADSAAARTIWNKILELDPNDARSLGALTRSYINDLEFDDLDALYRSREGGIEQLYDLLDNATATTESTQITGAIYRRMATIAENDLQSDDKVIISLESLLDIAEDPVMVARELITWYQKVEDIDREIDMNRLILSSHSEDDERLDTLERLRELEAKRGESESALRWALEAVKSTPTDDTVSARAEELARKVDALELYLQTLEDVAEVTTDDELQARLWARIGQIQWEDLQSYEAAVVHYERLYEREPTNIQWLSALEQLYELNDQPGERITILRAQIDVLKEGGATEDDLLDEYRKIADVQRQMGDPDAARKTYAELLDLDPDNLGALRGIKEIYRDEGRWEDVVDCLIREQTLIPLDDEARRIAVELELADVYRLNTVQLEDALRHYGQVLAMVPDQEQAVVAVESFFNEPTLAREAALMLEPIFRDIQATEQLVRALEARRAVADDRFEAAEILDELIPLYMGELEDRETAFDRAKQQFELDPDRSEIWLRLEQLGASLDKWEDLEAIFSKFAPEDRDAHPTRFDLLKHLAAIREYKLGMQEEALAAWEQLHEYDSMDMATIEALDRLYRGLGRHDKLIGVLEARAEVAEDPDDRVRLLIEAATIADDVVADTDRTIEIFRKVLIADPESQTAVSRLKELLTREQRWGELDELLTNQADFAADPDERRKLQLQLANVRWQHLSDYVGAADVVTQLLSNDPTDGEALFELQSLDEKLEQADESQLRLDLAAVVEPIHRSNEDWPALVSVLRIRLANTEDPFDRVQLLDELTALYVEQIGNQEEAFEMVSEAVRLSPDDEERREILEALGDNLNRIDSVLDTLAYAADEADSYVAADLFRRMGELFRDRMGAAEEAIACFEHALKAHPTDEELLSGLGALYEQIADHEKLAENLRSQSIYGDPERRPDFLRRIGLIERDVLERMDKAIFAYEELIEAEPTATDAMDALEMLYEGEERWIDLADILLRKANMAQDPTEQAVSLLRLATVQERSLDDRHAAIDTYRQVRSIDETDEHALEQLERLHSEEMQWAELSEVLRAKLLLPRAQDDLGFLNQTELRLGDVLAQELYAIDEALGLYRGVLERVPHQQDAIAALERLSQDEAYTESVAEDLIPHYVEAEEWEKLVDLYDKLQARTHDPELRSEYFHKIAQIERDGSGDTDAAITALANAWKLNVSGDELHDELLTVIAHTQDWRRLAQIYQDVLVEMADPDRMLELRLLLASLFYEQIGDLDEAEVHYRDALAIDDRHVEAYSALESILLGAERWHDLVALLETKFTATAVDDPDGARATLHRAAQIQEEFIEDDFTAVETYNRILELEPTDAEALAGVERLYRRQQRWEDLNAHLVRRIDLANDPDQIVALKSELAVIALEKLDDPLGSMELQREVLELNEDHEDTLVMLQGIFEQMPEFRTDAGLLLEPVLRRHELHENLLVVLNERAANVDYRHEAPNLLREVGSIAADVLGDSETALVAYQKIFEMEPQDDAVREKLAEIAGATQGWLGLTELYSKVIDDNYEIGDGLRVTLLSELAQMHEERLEDLTAARETFEKILTFDPEFAVALDSLDRIYSRQNDWEALVGLYRRRADVTLDPEQRMDWLFNLANLHEEILDDVNGAIEVYNEIIQVDPLADQPRRILERLLRQVARWEDLAILFREEVDMAEDEESRRERVYRLAHLLEGELDRVEEALELYSDILREHPGHDDTRRALEGLLRDLALEDTENAHLQVRIVDMLLNVYNPDDDIDKVVTLLEEKVRLSSDIPTKTSINREIADLLEGSTNREDRVRGMVALATAYRVDPLDADLKRRVNQIAMETETWDKLIPLYLEGLETTDDVDTQVHILNNVAEIYSGPLSDPESAITAFQTVMELNPDNDKALSQLEKLYSELELWEPLVDVLQRRVDVVYDADLQERLLRRVARIQEEILAAPAAAVDAVERLRELDPTNLEYITTLELLYEEVDAYDQLEELLRLKVGLLDDDAKRLKTLRNLARVQDEALGRPNDAIDSYRQVLAIDEEDVESVRALTRLFGKVERWSDLLEMLRVERDFAGGVDELNKVDLRIGIVLAERLEAGPEAIEKFNEVLGRDPGFVPARKMMTKLLDNAETGEQVQQILENLYRDQVEWSELQKLYEAVLEQVEDPDRRRAAYLKLGRLQEDELANPEIAFITFGRATREAPHEAEYRAHLEQLARELGSLDELLAVYEDCLEAGELDGEITLWLHKRLGAIYFELEAFDEAVTHFQLALEIEEYDRESLAALDDLYQIKQEFEALAGILERELSVVPDEEVNDVRYRLGYLHEVMFENRERALDLYAQILTGEPSHQNGIDAMERLLKDTDLRGRVVPILEPIFEEYAHWGRLAQVYELQLQIIDDPIDEANVLDKLANIYLNHLDKPHDAYANLTRSLRADPLNHDVQVRLEALAADIGMEEALVAFYEELMEDVGDPVRVVELALVAGTVSYTELEDVGRAWSTLQKVLEIDRDNEAALATMEEIARDQGDPDSLAHVLSREAEIVSDPEHRKRILADLGRVRVELEQFEKASEAFRAALEIDESDPDVLNAFVEVLEFTENYEELVVVMGRLVSFEHDPQAQFRLYVRMGRYSRVLLKDDERAIEAYRAALQIDPDDDEVLKALAELFREAEDWSRLRKVVDRRIHVIDDPDTQVTLYLELAKISRTHFNEIERAIEEYNAALRLAPAYTPTMEALGEIYRAEERWAELLQMYEQVHAATPASDTERVIELQVEMADISAKYLGDEHTAIGYLNTILEMEPDHLRALDVLADLYGQMGNWEEGLKLMERRMKACRTKEEQIEALMHRAHIFADELNRPKDAANDYVRIVELEPLHEQALGALKQLYGERLQAHKALFDILKFEAAHRPTTEEKLAIYTQMAGIAQDILGDPALTIDALEAAKAISGDLGIVEPLIDAYIQAGQTEKAAPVLADMIEQLKSARKMKDVVRFMHLQGKLAEQTGDIDAAYEAYDAAHKVDASYIPNLLSLGKLLYQKQDWDQSLKIFQTLLLHQMNIEKDADKVDIYYHLGMVRWHQGDTRRAKDMFNRALNIDGSHGPSKEAISQL